jgi:hypothetical protein
MEVEILDATEEEKEQESYDDGTEKESYVKNEIKFDTRSLFTQYRQTSLSIDCISSTI